MNQNAPLVCIITPFYNTGEYLSQCIESVLQQTYENWEYILVNNCSTDNSVAVAEHYVQLHPHRIRLENNAEFVSQIQNYNQALRLVSPESKYCKIAQADDILFPQYLEMMVGIAERDPLIGVVGSYAIEGRFVCFDGIPYPSSVLSGKEVCRLFFIERKYVFGSQTQLLMRTDMVLSHAPFYDEAYSPFSDAAAIFQLLAEYKFGFAHQVLTFSRRDNQSTMQSLLDLDSPASFELWMLRNFGRNFLSPSEYRDLLRWKERIYAQLLVEGIIGLKGKEFRRFHATMLNKMGYRLRTAWELWLLFGAICGVVFNPMWAALTVARGLRRLWKKWGPFAAKTVESH